MMLDVAGLPKNINGFRTTHTCELCGFEPRTKNKYREKQDHLVMKHFKEKIDKIFPHCRPYACPAGDCPFTGKDKQALLRHYTGKHGILERYLREALAEKGIAYVPGEGGKRRHSDSSNSSTGSTGVGRSSSKNPRLTLTPPGQVVNGAVTTMLDATTTKQVTLPTRQTSTEDLRKEVEVLMRSFQPVVEQPVAVLQIPSVTTGVNTAASSVNGDVNVSLPTVPVSTVINSGAPGNAPPPGAAVTTIPVVQTTQTAAGLNNGGPMVATAAPSSSSATVVPVASLPAIVLSAVANATAASVSANGTNGAANGLPSNVSLPTQPSNVPTITVSSPVTVSAPQQQATPVIIQQNKLSAPVASLIANGPSASSLPLPLEVIANGNVGKMVANGDIKLNGAATANGVKILSNGLSNGLSSNGGTTSPSPVTDDVMWSAVNSGGPAVVVEAANTVPVAYVADANAPDVITFASSSSPANNVSVVAAPNGGATTIDTIDYDYLYAAGAGGAAGAGAGAADAVGNARERQLDFCML